MAGSSSAGTAMAAAVSRRITGIRWILLTAGMLALIIVPFAFFGESLEVWTAATLSALSDRPLSSAAAIVVILASDIALPVPSSVMSALAGVVLGVAPGTAASWLGMTLGCTIGYGVGRTAGKGAASSILGVRELQRLEERTRRHGDWAIVAVRAIPVLAEASTIFAGMGRMKFGRFLALTCLSNLGISFAYASVGALAAEVGSFLIAVAGAVSVPLLAGLMLRALDRRNAHPIPS